MDAKKVKEQLVGAGIEVYRARPTEIHIAERVRLHLMDSGIRVLLGEELRVTFTARSQRSDFPDSASEVQLFARIRGVVGPGAEARGYAESWSGTTQVRDPINDAKILDVWHEVTWTKPLDGVDAAIDEIRWALGLERYVAPAS
jgi:hypothetical protein